MSGELRYGKQKEAYTRGTNYYAWKFPGDIDDTAPDWITREVGNKLVKQENGTWKFGSLPLERGFVFMYNSVRMEFTVSDSGMFQAHYFVVYDNDEKDEKEKESEVEGND